MDVITLALTLALALILILTLPLTCKCTSGVDEHSIQVVLELPGLFTLLHSDVTCHIQDLNPHVKQSVSNSLTLTLARTCL